MNIYKLTRIAPTEMYDAAYGFVVIAADEAKARLLCCVRCGDEGADYWADPARSKIECIGVAAKAKPHVVMRDFHAA